MTRVTDTEYEKSDSRPIAYIPGLDGLRFIAFLLVFYFHFNLETGVGWYGVDLFFVISGYLITTILISIKKSGGRLFPFYVRRALRILPLYYLFLIVAIGFFGYHSGGNASLLANITHTSNLYFGYTGQWFLPKHVWSLSMEEQFYLLWPLVVLLLSVPNLQRLLRYMIMSAVLARIAAHLAGFSPTAIYTLPWFRWDTLGSGALLALSIESHDPIVSFISRYRWKFLILSVLVIWCATAGNIVKNASLAWPAIGFSSVILACGCLVAAVINRDYLVNVLEVAPLRFLGKISYGLYLWHPLVRWLLIKYFGEMWGNPANQDPLIIALTLLGTVLIASVSWFLFERPILSLKRVVAYS